MAEKKTSIAERLNATAKTQIESLENKVAEQTEKLFTDGMKAVENAMTAGTPDAAADLSDALTQKLDDTLEELSKKAESGLK